MKTEDLITSLASQNGRQQMSPTLSLAGATIVAAVATAALLMLTIGFRPDFFTALGSIRFDFKFVVTIALAATAFAGLRMCLYPETSGRLPLGLLLVSPLLLLGAVGAELWATPADAYAMTAVGKNAMLCLTVIPALGIVPLGLLLWALRQGAPTRPSLAGLCAGLMAGGISATFYAANCTDDSPLFVATWYPIGILLLGAAGALLARRVARW